ncbi:MAG: nucleotidyltransferase family protein [Gemmatimonadetes bacterium]|nr:nucleotidyltransferase family protein [Gemmatimonadota bacterium]
MGWQPDGTAPAPPPPRTGTPRAAEMELLVACAHPRLDGARRARIAALLERRLDWDRAIRLARRHGLLPLLYQNLDRAGRQQVPAESLATLRAFFVENAVRSLELAGELITLLRLFAEAGVTAVPYKGQAMAARLYGGPGLRQAGDLDILVAPEAYDAARRVLLARGYEPRHALSAAKQAIMRDRWHCEPFEHPAGFAVELHWAFTSWRLLAPLDLHTVAPRLEHARLGGASLPMLGDEDLLLVLCIHGARHLWSRLEWVVNVAVVGERLDAAAWERILGRATPLGCQRAVLLGAVVAHRILDMPLPAAVLARAAADRALARLQDVTWRVLLDDADEPGRTGAAWAWQRERFLMHLHERRRDGLRFLWSRATTPKDPEQWVTLGVWRGHIRLHRLIEPIRIGPKLVGALLRRTGR